MSEEVSLTKPRFAYFGTPEFATIVLDELERAGYLPLLVVTAPPKPKGRKLILTASPVEAWAKERNIPVLAPTTLRDEVIEKQLKSTEADLFIVAAYGKIIPKNILEIPKNGTLNVHPSLLPKFRGPSPIESAILSDEPHTGVSIMVLDEALDHGPVVAQRERVIVNWPLKASLLTKDLAHFGGKLLAEIIPEWFAGLSAHEQDHSRATFTKKITKEDGLLDLSGDAQQSYKKIRAFDDWPGAYFFTERNGKQIRVRITDATYRNGALTILSVIPEGKKEMRYEDFLRGAK